MCIKIAFRLHKLFFQQFPAIGKDHHQKIQPWEFTFGNYSKKHQRINLDEHVGLTNLIYTFFFCACFCNAGL